MFIERSFFFFRGLRRGLTNRVPVRDSDSRTPLVIWVVRLLEGWTNTLIDKGGDRMRFEKKKFLNVCFLCFLTSSPYEILTVLILYSPLTIDHLASYIYFSICLDCLPVFLQWFGWDWSNGLVKDA